MTYSLIAADPATGAVGIAAQSHHFAVGARVVAARAGVGVAAIQSYADPQLYGARLMAELEAGVAPARALEAATRADPRASRAQVAVVTAGGDAAATTGTACVPTAGHTTGSGWSAQANMVHSHDVWEGAAAAYSAGIGDFASRLLSGLRSAEAAGGDLRGRQSAVLVVRLPVASGAEDVDLRVDDHPDPLGELTRLDGMRRAALQMTAAFGDASRGDIDKAVDRLSRAQETYGDNPEPSAWAAVLLARVGRTSEAKLLLDRAIATTPTWRTFVENLPAAGLLSQDMAALLGSAE